ncbi:MAG: sulfatase [Halapricum sp.]
MSAGAADRPNVLFVLTDQWRAQALGCMGNEQVHTPTVDRLADEGMTFERAYTPKPMCVPARASLLTGTHPHRNRVVHNQLRLPDEYPTVADALGAAGYDTGYVGKWHLDGVNSLYVPPDRRGGFDFWEGFNTTSHDYDRFPRFDENGEVTWEEGYQPAIETDVAIDYLEATADVPAPFFLFVSWGPPHPPKGGWRKVDAPAEYTDRYDPGELTLRPNVPDDGITLRPHLPLLDSDQVRRDLVEYYGYISSLDHQLCRLLDALDRFGLSEDTLVVFASDHGEMLGSHGRYNKGAPFEEAIHVPLVFRWPGAIEPGRRSDALVSLNDIMPTLVSLCEVDIPDGVQGHDYAPHVRGDPSPETADAVYIQDWRVENDIPDEPDWGPWGQPWRMVRTDRYALMLDCTLETRYLFDVREDPYQMNNLAGDPSVADVEARLRERLFEFAHGTDDREFVVRHLYIERTDDLHDR